VNANSMTLDLRIKSTHVHEQTSAGREKNSLDVRYLRSNVTIVAPIQHFARRIQTLRHARGLGQVGLAKAAGISRGYLARIEIGRHWPSLEVIEKLAKALKVKPSALLEYGKKESKKQK
jgi:ribosome-binding protein aMBF1 (putative translation factor)